METVKKYLRVILNIVIPVAAIGLLVYLGPKLLRFFLPFVIGWILAMIANPLVRFLERRLKLVRRHSSILIVVVVLAGVIGLIYLIVSRLIIEGTSFLRDLPAIMETVSEEVRGAMGRFEGLFFRLPEETREALYRASENLDEYVGMAIQKLTPTTVSAAGSVAKWIPNVLVNTVVMILSSYFFIVERDGILRFLGKFMPESGGRYYRFLKKDVKKADWRVFSGAVSHYVCGGPYPGCRFAGAPGKVQRALGGAHRHSGFPAGVRDGHRAHPLGRDQGVFRGVRLRGGAGADLRAHPGGAADDPAENCGGYHRPSASHHPVFPVSGIQMGGPLFFKKHVPNFMKILIFPLGGFQTFLVG